MPTYHACDANISTGEPIEPINRKRVRDGRHWVPDCPDYLSKFGLPAKVKMSQAYAGWSCWNCRHLLESTDPFAERKHASYTAQRSSSASSKHEETAEPEAAKKSGSPAGELPLSTR